MKRADFEARFESLGLTLGPYENAAYYGARQKWSLSLSPFASDKINHAKLAISVEEPSERAVIVNTFLSAADVPRTPLIDQNIAAQKEFRIRIGPKQVSSTRVAGEIVLNVFE